MFRPKFGRGLRIFTSSCWRYLPNDWVPVLHACTVATSRFKSPRREFESRANEFDVLIFSVVPFTLVERALVRENTKFDLDVHEGKGTTESLSRYTRKHHTNKTGGLRERGPNLLPRFYAPV